MSDEGPVETPKQNRLEQLKEIARLRRRAAYQKAKARVKAQKIARGPDLRVDERKQRANDARRAAYLKAKAYLKVRQEAAKVRVKEAKEKAAEDKREKRQTALREQLIVADELPAVRPKLRLVK